MGAAMDSFVAGLRESGHTPEIADLCREGFDPVMKPEDYAAFAGRRMPDDVLREQRRVERADAVALVYPIFWWSFPAILKGWFDRVFCQGWAFDSPEEPVSILQRRKWAVICSAGLSEHTYDKYGYRQPIEHLLTVGTLGYCGVRDVVVRILFDVDLTADPKLKAAYLAELRALGAGFADEACSSRPHVSPHNSAPELPSHSD